MEYTHYPVMLRECIDGLNIRPEGTYLDATLGLGGHSLEIAKRLKTGRLICIDRDETALERARPILAPFMERITLAHGNYRDLKQILSEAGAEKVDGILFDNGVSSPQIDEEARGFSFMAPGARPDMRMDRSESLTAADILNGWDYESLKRIFYDFGQERYAPQLARAITRYREKGPIETNSELLEIIKSAIPRDKQRPAKLLVKSYARVFQALRIAVNDELDALSRAMDAAADSLNPGGRLCALSFHSLEDKIVKSAISAGENGCTCPRDFPVCVCGFARTLKSVSRGAILPTAREIEENPRSRSARLRIAERV